MIKPLWISMRPKQWVKNLVLFAGILFSHNLADMAAAVKTIAAFLLFCLLSSSVYLINDVKDRDVDRLHPEKRKRPIASGQLSPLSAWTIAAVYAVIAIGASYLINMPFGLIATGYFVLMLLYTFYFKQVVLIDVFTIASGFILRAVAGAAVIAVPISEWLLICVTSLSLFLGFTKRRQGIDLDGEQDMGRQPTVTEYTPLLLDQMIAITAAATIVFYSLYTLSAETVAKFQTNHLMYTIPFVIYGVLRYIYMIYKRKTKGNPEIVLLTDRWLMGDVLLYVIAAWFIIYR